MVGSFSMTAEGTVRGWTRWEEFSPVDLPEGSARSLTQLMEVDCRAGRGRLLALDIYPYNNLKGTPHHVDAQDPQWAYPRPGTVLEQNINTMCAAARSALTVAVMQAREDGQPTPAPGERSTALASLR